MPILFACTETHNFPIEIQNVLHIIKLVLEVFVPISWQDDVDGDKNDNDSANDVYNNSFHSIKKKRIY